MKNEVLIAKLMEYAEWAEGFCCGVPIDVPIDLPDVLKEAADFIEKAANPATIDELGLSVRSYNALYRWDVRLVRDLAKMDEAALVKIPGIGKGAAKEIMEKLKEAYK